MTPPREDTGAASKAELLKRIEVLLEKNERYEMRFRGTPACHTNPFPLLTFGPRDVSWHTGGDRQTWCKLTKAS
jgi:hypothetical protein